MKENKFKSQKEIIVLGSLVILGRLGQGSTSHVFKTQSIKTKELYAMKVIDKTASNYNSNAIINEVQIHQKLSHRNISHFIAHLEDSENHYLLTEYCEGGEITKMLLEEANEKKLIEIGYELALALDYLHNDLNISHGDLKLSNVLMKKSSIKLCDFGFSQKLDGSLNTASFGTLTYMSPQIMIHKQRKHHKQADVWAYGIIILTLMLRKKPYVSENYKNLRSEIIKQEYLQPEKEEYSEELIGFVSQILNPDYQKRPKIKEILNHRIFNDYRSEIKNCLIKNMVNKENKEEGEDLSEGLKTPMKKHASNKRIMTDMTETIKKLPEEESEFDKTICKNEKVKKIISHCLSPQFHKTKNQGEIQILANKDVQIKIKDIKYVISSCGQTLALEKKKSKKTYTFQQIEENDKIKSLYKYGRELVNLLKRNQGIKEFTFKDGYFWHKKKENIIYFRHKEGTHLQHDIESNIVIVRKEEQKQISWQKLHSLQQEEVKLFLEGEKWLRRRIEQSK